MENEKNGVSLILMLTVGIILVGSLMVPVITGTTEIIGTETDNENAGVLFSSEPATIKCSSDGEWLVDGVAVTDHTDGYLISDGGIVTMSIGSSTSGFFVLSDGTNGTLRNIIVTDDGFSYATTSDTDTYIDVPCEYVYYSADDGDYALFTDSFNADDGDNVIAFNKGSTGYLCAQLNESEVNFFNIGGEVTEATIVSDATITAADGYNEWSSAAWTLTYGESTLTGTKVIAPATYTVRTEEQNSMVTLMYVIPAVVLISLVAIVANRVRNE